MYNNKKQNYLENCHYPFYYGKTELRVDNSTKNKQHAMHAEAMTFLFVGTCKITE